MFLVDTDDRQGEPQVHLNITFVKSKFVKPIHVKIPQFRFLLERTTYYSGQRCQGAVLFYVGKPVKFKDLTLTFLGRTVTFSEANNGKVYSEPSTRPLALKKSRKYQRLPFCSSVLCPC